MMENRRILRDAGSEGELKEGDGNGADHTAHTGELGKLGVFGDIIFSWTGISADH